MHKHIYLDISAVVCENHQKKGLVNIQRDPSYRPVSMTYPGPVNISFQSEHPWVFRCGSGHPVTDSTGITVDTWIKINL